MYPDLLHIGPIVIHTYGLMVALGILAGVSLAEYLHRRDGGEPGRMVDMALLVVVSGLAGARLFFVLVNLEYYKAHPLETVMIWKGGLVFYGSLIGGAAGLVIAARLYRLPLARTLDVGAPAMALGHALGRLGCFFAGCCHGCPVDLPWSVTFTDPRSLATTVLGKPVHPTQLYEAAFLALLTLFLVWLHPRKRFDGQMAALYLILYPLFRFGVEFLRCDPRGSMAVFGWPLATSQVISLAVLPVGVLLYWILGRRNPEASRVLKNP